MSSKEDLAQFIVKYVFEAEFHRSAQALGMVSDGKKGRSVADMARVLTTLLACCEG